MFFFGTPKLTKKSSPPKTTFWDHFADFRHVQRQFLQRFFHFGSLPGLFWQVFSGFNFDIEFQAFLDAKNLKTKNEKVAPDM